MDFPIIDLLDNDQSIAWLEHHFHPQGQQCPPCGARRTEARFFRITRGRGLPVWRWLRWQGIAHRDSGTIVAGSHLAPLHVVLLWRGVLQAPSSAHLARDIGRREHTVVPWRQRLQARAAALQPPTPRRERATERDELVQNAGATGAEHGDPADPARRRANQRRGGPSAHDRPPIVGTVGRDTGPVRLRGVRPTTGRTRRAPGQQGTGAGTPVYTDADDSDNHLARPHATVSQSHRDWARDDDGDGIRDGHTNTWAGMWAGLGTFLRPFRGVHKRFLRGYVAIHEFRVNLKRISVSFIAALVGLHSLYR